MKTTSATRRRCVLFLAVLLLSAGSLIAESGSFLLIFRDGGPFRVKQAVGGATAPQLNLTQSADAATWPDFTQVVWPQTETRPAPARGQVQGLVFVNDFDPAVQAETGNYDEMLAHFRECASVAMIAASRPGKYFLEMFVFMSDTSQAWKPWGNTGTVMQVSMAPDTKLTCTLRTN